MSSDGGPSVGQPVAFITGAGSGIGWATAELFAARGWWVGAADIDEDRLEQLRHALGAEQCRCWHLDVTDKPAYDAVISELEDLTTGRLDLLFNNAGIGAAGFFEEIPLEASLKVVEVNLIGVLNGIYAALPLLESTPNSLCFSTSSSAATFGSPGLAVYTATKFAVKGLTEALAVELSRHGVRVADVLPGIIDTAIFAETPVYVEGQLLPPEMSPSAADNAAPDGAFRLVPPRAVAEAVWRCYEGEDRLHWYVPEEVEDVDRAKADALEAMRDERIASLRATLGIQDEEPER